jgi:hypothetical protein
MAGRRTHVTLAGVAVLSGDSIHSGHCLVRLDVNLVPGGVRAERARAAAPVKFETIVAQGRRGEGAPQESA